MAEQPAPRSQPQAVSPTRGAPTVQDVALHSGGLLLGQVVNVDGTAQAGMTVKVCQADKEIGATVTDRNGHFRFAGLEGGTYQIGSPQGNAMYRLWAPNTAPPAAKPAAMIVDGHGLVRGQTQPRHALHWLTNPYVLTGLIGTAIAIPIVLNNTDDDDSGS